MKNFLVIGFWSLVIATPIMAQTPTPTSIRDSVKKQVDEELAMIKKAISKRAYLGKITAKSDATLTITTPSNATHSVTVTPDSAIKLAGGKDGTLADLKENLTILAMGDADAEGKLTAKRLLVIPTPPADKRQVVLATVSKVTVSQVTATDTQGQSLIIKLSSTTKYTGKTKASDIKVDSKIVIIGTQGTTANTLTARLIHLLQSP